MIPFGDWLPDLAEYGHPGLVLARNASPLANGAWRHVPGPVVVGKFHVPGDTQPNATSLRPRDSGEPYIYVTTQETDGSYRIWELYSGAEVTSAANPGYCSRFFLFYDKVYVAGSTKLYSMLPGQSQFQIVAGAPGGRHLTVIGDYLIVGSTYTTTDGTVRFRLQWCGTGNATQWTVGQNNSDFQDLDGPIVTMVGGADYGIVFTTKSVYRMSPAAPPIVFQFQKILTHYAAESSYSPVAYGANIYYIAPSGVYGIMDGSQLKALGQDVVDREITQDFLRPKSIGAALDQSANIIAFSYRYRDGVEFRLICYNIVTGKWFQIELDGEPYIRYPIPVIVSNDVRLETTVLGFISSETPQGIPAATAWVFGGDPLVAELMTGDQGGQAQVTEFTVRPYVQGSENTRVQVALGFRNSLSDPLQWTPMQDLDSLGEVHFRKTCRYYRFRFQISGGFKSATGYDVDLRLSGMR